ncbi:MAG: DegT/DnrJ/EryC1/StrS family aminotransferase [Syntrophales bacterium]
MIPASRPNYSYRELMASVFHSAGVMEEFESELAAHFGVRHAITFPYGRSALYAALKAIDRPGCEVIQPAYNCVVVAHASFMAGYNPVFVDTSPDSPNQDPEQMIDRTTSRTVAAIPTSIFGMNFDAANLSEAIRRRNKNTIIFIDCCQCFDARWNGEMLAGCGDGAFLAFGIGKPMTSLYGGAFLTNRESLAQSVRRYRDTTFTRRSGMAGVMRWLYFVVSWAALSVPFVRFTDAMVNTDTPLKNYLLTLRSREAIRLPADNETMMLPLEAAIGRTQLRRVSAFMERRREIAQIYEKEFAGLPEIQLLPWTEGSTYTIYSIVLKHPEDRARILASLRKRGIQGSTILDYVIPGLDCYREKGYSPDLFPHAGNWAASVINLSNHSAMTERQVRTVVGAVKEVLKEMYA